jgi:hypothetical protein
VFDNTKRVWEDADIGTTESLASGTDMWCGGGFLLGGGKVKERVRGSKQGGRSSSVRSTRTESLHP